MSRSAEVMHQKAAQYNTANSWGQQQEIDEDEDDPTVVGHKGQPLEMWGNQKTMNMNNIVISNVLQSPYFKNVLIKMKTFHEVIDEIYYKVDHLEPWERGTRKTSGQVGMCGGVRGVGAGGVVSSAYCLLFKLFTLKLTEKQLLVLLNHGDSPYIRGLGFMFVRYCIDPKRYWYWFELYLEDQEEIDPKSGGGATMTIGQMVRAMILRLDWYGTLFPRIPVPVHKDIEKRLTDMNLNDDRKRTANEMSRDEVVEKDREPVQERTKTEEFGEAEKMAQRRREEEKRHSKQRSSSRDRTKDKEKERSKVQDRHVSSSDRDRHKKDRRSRDRSRSRDKKRSHRDRSRDRDRDRDSKKRDHKSSTHSRDHKSPRKRSRSPKRRDKSPSRRDKSPSRRDKSPSRRDKSPSRRRSRSRDRSPVRKRSRSRDRR